MEAEDRLGDPEGVVRGVVEYDGTNYRGFQRLSRCPSIQGAIEAVCTRLMGPTAVVGAGRTDAGAHAVGQVISFHAPWRRGLPALHRALNALLPDDIAIRELAWAPAGFHARHDAVARWYRYTVRNQPHRSPLWQRYTHHVPQPLDLDSCNAVCSRLVGTHDLGVFASGPVARTVRTIYHLACVRQGLMVEIDVVISGAFSHLIRRLAATVIEVGLGHLDTAAFLDALTSGDRRRVAPPAPARGLCLMEVFY